MSSALASLSAQFAEPTRPFDPAVLDAIVVAHARATIEQWLDHSWASVATAAPALAATISRWAAAPRVFADVWDPSVAAVVDASDAPEDALRVAAELGLRAVVRGEPADWSLDLPRPCALAWAGSPLPASSRIAVESDGSRVTLRLADATTSALRFVREGDDWRAVDGPPFRPPFGPPRCAGVRVRAAEHTPARWHDLTFFRGAAPVAAIDAEALAVVAAAFAALARWSPAYRRWVERVVTDVVVLRAPPLRSLSGTCFDAPGVVAMSLADAAEAAGVLVHEASHLYFHALRRAGPLADPTHTRLYHSCVARRERPLERVLIAYHAFANVLLLYRGWLADGFEDTAGIAGEVAGLEAEVAQLAAPLHDSEHLTPTGRTLYSTLAARLAEAPR